MKHPAYLLKGERFLVDEAIDRVRRETDADPLSEVSLEASEVTAAELLSALGTASLLGGVRLVIVRSAQDLKKDHAEALARYLGSPSPDSILVLAAAGRTKLDDAVKKAGAVITLDAPKGRKLVSWIRERALVHGLKLDDRGGWAFVDSVGTELRDIDAALQQIATASGPGARIGAAEVRGHFPRLADERIYAFTDGVGDRRLPVAMTALRRLLEQGDHPLALFGALASQVRRMLRARGYADRGAEAVGAALGMPGWRAERLTKQARSYREEELVAAMGILAETDVEMKGGGDLSAENALERAVVLIVTGAEAGRRP
ncbi:MAG: DNA polymerase III subunit delta [Actinomycetota bacterium]|nr:DNA polymerase III subunit delta [Actinomycetota bacterium]